MHLILPDMLPLYVNAINNYIAYNKNELGLLSKTLFTKEDDLRKAKYVSALHFASRLQASSPKEVFDASMVEDLFNDEQEKIKRIRGKHAPGVYDGLLREIVEHIETCKIAESQLNSIVSRQKGNTNLHRLLIDIYTYMCTLKFDEYMSRIPKLPSLNKWSKTDAGCIRDSVKKIINNIHSKIDKEFINDPQIIKIIKQLEIIKNKSFNDKMAELSSALTAQKSLSGSIWQFSGNFYNNQSDSFFCWRPGSASESDFELDDISGLFSCSSAPILGMFDKSKIEKKLILTDRPRQREIDSSPLHKKSRQQEIINNNELERIPSFKL